MNGKYFYLLIQVPLILGMRAASANAQDSYAVLPEIIQNLQKTADFLVERIFDIVSTEDVTMERLDSKGKIKKTANVNSKILSFTEKNKQRPYLVYKYEYSNYRIFNVTTNIKYE